MSPYQMYGVYMLNSSDVIKKITEIIKDKIEDELYLINNQNALSEDAYIEFLEIEDIVQELMH